MYDDHYTRQFRYRDELAERLARADEIRPRTWYQHSAWILLWLAVHLFLIIILIACTGALIWLIPRFPL